MKWIIDKNRPICPQICEQLCMAIASKRLLSIEKVYSFIELALKLGVNPNTVQKSYDILEEKGIIFSVRGSGWFVSEDTTIAKEVVKGVVESKVLGFFKEMEQLGFDEEMVMKYLKERKGE